MHCTVRLQPLLKSRSDLSVSCRSGLEPGAAPAVPPDGILDPMYVWHMSSDEVHHEVGAPDDERGNESSNVLRFPSVTRRARPTPPDQRLRTIIGGVLRDERLEQGRTLADVAAGSSVSLPYLSEIERGRKEISSDLLASVAGALDLTLVHVLERCVDRLRGGGSERNRSFEMRAA
jgi:Helix-turn-helix